jgi:hypothetical protein
VKQATSCDRGTSYFNAAVRRAANLVCYFTLDMKVPAILLSILLLAQVPIAFAMETDQFNLPPVQLADIGDEVTQYVADNIAEAIKTLNGRIALHQGCLDAAPAKNTTCGSVVYESQKLAYLRSNDALAKEVFLRLGDGNIFVSKSGQWVNSHRFNHSPERYKAEFTESIYMAELIDYATLSPTVKLYGVEFGTDKIDHMFQQGYIYYRIYKDTLRGGHTADEAQKQSVKWGQMTERTYYGLLVSGVYSNADLAANFAGLRFYQGLSQPLEINGKTRPAVLALHDGRWEFAGTLDRSETLLKPLLTDHLNEALNPSGYTALLYPFVQTAVKNKSCPKWRKAYPQLNALDLEKQSLSLERWNDEDYGFARSALMVRLGGLCFADEKQ